MMWRHDNEGKTLLIDRAAAADVPRDDAIREWARDKRAFISSVMAGLAEERAAAAAGVRSLGARPVMFENFGGRDADPVDAYLGDVETSQIYLGILGQRYGKLLPTHFSATHTEFRHAEQHGLRIAVWALAKQQREGPQQSFLDEVRAFHVVPSFDSPADLQQQVSERLRDIAAEDLSPWTKLGVIMFRASEVKHSSNNMVTARVQSDDVAYAIEALAPDNFGAVNEYRFTWSGRCRRVKVANIQSTTTTARSKLMQLELNVVESHRDALLEVGFNNLTPADLTNVALRVALFKEPHPLAKPLHGSFMAHMPDPFQLLRDAGVSDEITRALAEVMLVDEMVGSGRAARVTQFRLGATMGGVRKLQLEWEDRHQRKHPLEGQVQL